MENASKALLIAAAVLIVILLIAFGMKILGSSDNTIGEAEKAGESIRQQSIIAIEKATEAIKGTEAAGGQPAQTQEEITFYFTGDDRTDKIEWSVAKGTTWKEFIINQRVPFFYTQNTANAASDWRVVVQGGGPIRRIGNESSYVYYLDEIIEGTYILSGFDSSFVYDIYK